MPKLELSQPLMAAFGKKEKSPTIHLSQNLPFNISQEEAMFKKLGTGEESTNLK